ncbi:ricin-type beta-trefoil lectin domain protein [Jiangella alkaliphila]|uniref:Carbohydrate binding domain-containing protein n=1 Tax=Jiangella alkaliphila TaxID=419479 RepID=A0A1H2L3V6_9ACTN|nr:ricin-type beta-trefoil lectin domain protein [Jiangella alkaliphila]SDU75425.1 Carbohydrate binding domain-containing protein [Jiangella alkaliphila]
MRLRSLMTTVLLVVTTLLAAPVATQSANANTLETFTLPGADANGDINHANIVTAFPSVDWETLDRLYIPAGQYRSIHLGGLPDRDADRPLVITNSGGQVRVGGENHPYVFAVNGGRNWVLTGRYDAAAQTGHTSYRGHADGDWADSQDTYGIVVDDEFSRQGGIGLSVSSGASHFELDMIEIRRLEFAGLMMKTDNTGAATMRSVRVHDLYIHDTGAEGIYMGSTQAQPQHIFENVEIYNNRVLRTGTEALQVGQAGDQIAVHHNVFGPAATRWRSAFSHWQDGNIQWGQRYGSAAFHDNVVIGTGDLFIEFFPTTVSGDPYCPSDTVTFEDNYFADTSYGGVFTHAGGTGVDVEFTGNTWRGFNFNYNEVYPNVTAPADMFSPGDTTSVTHRWTDNVIDGPPLQATSRPNVTDTNTTYATVPRVQFRDFMGSYLDQDYRRLEWWTDRETLQDGQPVMVYDEGDVVVHGGTLYEALEDNQEVPPGSSTAVWQALPQPSDDVRLTAASPHAGVGVGDNVTGYLVPDPDPVVPSGQIVGIASKCVTVENGNTANTTPIELEPCGAGASQTWSLPGDGSIRALGKCLDVQWGLTPNGTVIQLYDCIGSGSQQWVEQTDGELLNPQSGRCLSTTGGSSANGTRLIIWDCLTRADQVWALP